VSERLNTAPTRSALLNLRRQVSFLQQGHDLLERKRELLTRLVHERLAQYRRLRGEVRSVLTEAYRWVAINQLRMTHQSLKQAALGLEPGLEVRVLPRSSIGVEYPSVQANTLPLKPVGLMWTDPSFDETRRQMARASVLLAKLGEAETALWRLLTEQRKTQKRVNALKYNVIPKHQRTVEYIRSVLEEEERNTLFQIKLLEARRREVK
jgi:V/A-type H+-transporting ATPase subunit D